MRQTKCTYRTFVIQEKTRRVPWPLTHPHVTHVPQKSCSFPHHTAGSPQKYSKDPWIRMSLDHGGSHFDRAVSRAVRERPMMGWWLTLCLLVYPEVPQSQQVQDILPSLCVIKSPALPCFWIFGLGQTAQMLAYFQDLPLTRTTFPAVTFGSLFHISFAPLKQNHHLFNSQALVPP